MEVIQETPLMMLEAQMEDGTSSHTLKCLS